MVRVRFAPSPTGALHIGGVRTALYNYLFARRHQGVMLLRIEDTDSKRFVPGAEAYIKESLEWLGIKIDEGQDYGGDHGPYRQSERRDIYRQYVDQLLRDGKAYKAYDTPEELDEARKKFPNFQYDAQTRMQMRNSLSLSDAEQAQLLADNTPYVVRFKIEPGEEVVVDDMIRGKVAIMSDILDDKVLYKSSDDLPTYHLANIVDDHLMQITHVIRGEEWLPSSPLHKLLYRALGWEDTMPRFAHLSLLLKPEGDGKLSKRDGDRLGFPVFPLEWRSPEDPTNVSMGFREQGYLPEAVVNFLALLGWNPGNDQEVLSMDELIALFDLERCNKSGARFDVEKAKWFNHHYLQSVPSSHFLASIQKEIATHETTSSYSDEEITEIIDLVKDRAYFAKDLWEQAQFFFVRPTSYDPKTAKKRWKEDSPAQLTEMAQWLESIASFDASTLETAIPQFIEQRAYPMGQVMNALRLALVGESRGPHIHEIMALLGKEECQLRIQRAIETLA